ncbi:hypothetical protein WDU94_006251, partial [Cyamophila willieti]
ISRRSPTPSSNSPSRAAPRITSPFSSFSLSGHRPLYQPPAYSPTWPWSLPWPPTGLHDTMEASPIMRPVPTRMTLAPGTDVDGESAAHVLKALKEERNASQKGASSSEYSPFFLIFLSHLLIGLFHVLLSPCSVLI